MIVTAAYLTSRYGKSDASPEIIDDMILMAQGAVEGMIGQPVERRVVPMTFTGTGTLRKFVPYSLLPEVDSVEVLQPDLSWSAEDIEVIIVEQCAATVNGWSAAKTYRMNLEVGLAPCEEDEQRSADFANPRYGKLLRAVCDIAWAKMQEHTTTQSTGAVRFGVKSLASSNGGGSATTVYDDVVRKWANDLSEFKRLPSW